jgi:hypothetical protein
MVFKTWQEADKALEVSTGPATSRQNEIAKQIGIEISPDVPTLVFAAILKVSLATELDLPEPSAMSDRYEDRLFKLLRPYDTFFSPKTDEEAYAWVKHLRLVRRRENLSALELKEGDIVITSVGEVAEVSSIGHEGRVFFKGGRGFGAWPDQIEIEARSGDDSDLARTARRRAENLVSRRETSSTWSVARSNDLSRFITKNYVSDDDIVELESIVACAEDERPIQEFLENNPHLLTALLGGNDRYCIPQKRLGGEYVPDFIIGDVDSLGFRWVLVELETPRSGIYLKDGENPDAPTRTGANQIISWRNWLSDNIAYARQRRSENGLGLFDVREKSDGLVLVGQRSLMPETKDAIRQEYRQSNNIRIHSYNWLIDILQSISRHLGPPATNPHLIHRI